MLERSWDRNSVCPSVRPSHTCFVTKRKRYFDTTWTGNHFSRINRGWCVMSHSTLNLRLKWPTPFEKRRIRQIFAYNVSTCLFAILLLYIESVPCLPTHTEITRRRVTVGLTIATSAFGISSREVCIQGSWTNTLWVKKTSHYTFVCNFAKCWHIFKILSPTDSVVNLQ